MVLSSRLASTPAATGQVASACRGAGEVQIELLGPLRVESGGRAVPIDASKERAVLAVLALHAGHTLSTAGIIDALWGDDPPASAVKLVQTYVSSLRHLLGNDLIVTEPGGYGLDETVTLIDTELLSELAAAGRRLAAEGDLEGARRRYEEALALWRGDPLEDLADAPAAWGHRTRLDEQRLAIVEGRIEVDLASGRHRELIPELELVVHTHPLRERLWAALMLALYRSGRPGEALRAAARLREHLVDEMGITPTTLVTDLESQILAEDPALDVPPIPATGYVPGTLSSFVGRTDDVERIVELIAMRPLVTLLGVGGVGKSRLGLEVARKLRAAEVSTFDGTPIRSVWWVDLGSVTGPDVVARRVAHSMGLVVLPGTSLDDSLAARLRASTTVLVLDNCEHLVEPVAAFAAWARSVSSTHIVATSRVALGLIGEQRWRVEPLDVPVPDHPVDASDAVRLFLDRAGEHVDVADLDMGQIGRICMLVDGLPLAIEIVAPMCALMPLTEIVATLEDRSGLLGIAGTTGRGATTRRVSLREVLDIRRSGLDPFVRSSFLALSVFPGDFAVDAACDVIDGDRGDALTALGTLIDASLICVVHDSGTARRFRMLWPVREYADELIDPAPRQDAAAAHARHFRRVAHRVAEAVEGPHEADRIAELRTELHNVTAALAWTEQRGTPEATFELALALGIGWSEWGQYDVGRQHLGRLLEAGDDAPPDLVAWTRLQLVWPTLMGGDPASGLDLVERALGTFEELGDRRGIARALRDRAHVRLIGFADVERGFADYLRAIEIGELGGHATLVARTKALLVQSLAWGDQPEVVDCDRLLDEAESVFRAEGNDLGMAQVAFDRVFLAFGRDDVDAARGAAEQLERHGRQAKSLVYEQAGLVSQGISAHQRGQPERCAGLLQRAVHMAQHSGNRLQVGVALHAVAVTSAVTDPARAAIVWGAALELAPLWPLFDRRYGELLEPASEALGAQFDRLVAEGRQLSFEEAIGLSNELCAAD